MLDRVNAGTLTAVALEVALSELAVRGIEFPTPADIDAGEHGSAETASELPPDMELVTIAHFDNPLKASLVRCHLESEGIFVYLWGEYL